MTKSMNIKIRKIVTIALSCIILAMMALVAYLMLCSMSGKTAFIGKYAFVRIISPSMEPKIPTGEYILIEKTNPDSVKEKDIICFYSRDPSIYGKMNTHRVVEIIESNGEKQFVTKGDNNPVNDSYKVKSGDIAGKYVNNLSFVSKASKVFNNKIGFFILVLVPAFVLLVFCIVDVVKKSHEAKMDYLVNEELKKIKEQKENSSADNEEDSNNS